MSLFNIPSRNNDTARDKSLIKKCNLYEQVQSRVQVKSGKSLLSTIARIIGLVKDTFELNDESDLITTEERLIQYMDKCVENKLVAIDTETSGLNVYIDKLAGVCVYTEGEKPAYIPINHISYITGEKLDNQLEAKFVAEQLKRLSVCKNVFHNYMFDRRVLKNNLGIIVDCYHDTYIGGRILNENEPDNGLKYLFKKYVAQDDSEPMTFSKLFEGIPFNLIPPETGKFYATYDAYMTLELFKFQNEFLTIGEEKCKWRNLERVATLFREVEMPLLEVVSEMMDRGFNIDINKANELLDKYTIMRDEAYKKYEVEIHKLKPQIDKYMARLDRNKFEFPPNPNSPQQMQVLIYDILNLKPKLTSKHKKDKKTRPTDKDILIQFDLPLFTYLREVKNYDKLISTYIKAVIDKAKEFDGRVHCDFKTIDTDTGRTSCKNPNLQNLPSKNKDIRTMYIPTEGYALVCADYSQQEMMALASIADEEIMLQAFAEGKDIYSSVASLAFHRTYEECRETHIDGSPYPEGKKYRDRAKQMCLSIVYGKSTKEIANDLGCSFQEATEIKDAVLSAHPKLMQYLEWVVNKAKTEGFVETFFGRRRRLPNAQLPPFEAFYDDLDEPTERYAKSVIQRLNKCRNWDDKEAIKKEAFKYGVVIKDNNMDIADAVRQALNSPIQGTASDLTKKAMINIYRDKEAKELDMHLLINVHDELICEAPIKNASKAMEVLSRCMVEAGKELKAKLRCDALITDRWFGKELSDEDLEELEDVE